MKRLRKISAVLLLSLNLFFSFNLVAYASDLDSLTTEEVTTEETEGEGLETVNPAVTEYIKGYKAVTDENMKVASQITNPIVNIIGNLIGVLTIIAVAAVPLTTMIDLLYIGFPAVRPLLNPEYNMQPQGGMMGGMSPMGGYGMGRMGMGMGMGMGASQAPVSTGRVRLVSDEAIACTPQTAQAQPMAGGMSPMGGMGMGMGMGSMMGAAQQQQAPQTKSFIWEYFKKRMFFIILFVVSTILLTSSVLTDCGINIAQLIANIIVKFNDGLGNVSF